MRMFVSRTMIAAAMLAVLGAASMAPLAAPKTTPRFLDNGNGTVTDNQTGLMWEKKTESNVNDTYTWSATGTAPDGTLFTSFLATMRCTISASGRCGFGGHYDWRVPNVSELQTIQDCSQPNCHDPIFGPTAVAFYWSATTSVGVLTDAWGWAFADYNACPCVDDKAQADNVRAVRGGL